jgi:sugar phosphate isomerase/epimerase
MRLAAHTTGLLDFEFQDGLAFLERLGITAVELACAGVFTDLRYGDPNTLLDSDAALQRWRDAYKRHNLEICALSIHGEPLAPHPAVAAQYSEEFRRACRFAEKIGVSRLTLVAGLPEGAPGDTAPCWVVGLPPEFPTPNPDVVEWQWDSRLLPYWEEHAQIAIDHGCQLCFEPTAWDLVYNPRTLLKLRREIGEVVSCNFDPSHFFYQGIDVFDALAALGDVIALVHAKDTRLNDRVIRENGLYDLEPRSLLRTRPWSFATVGYGHDALFWREFIARLRLIGYDDVLSIEHEDPYLSVTEGVSKAAAFLTPLVFDTPAPEILASPQEVAE